MVVTQNIPPHWAQDSNKASNWLQVRHFRKNKSFSHSEILANHLSDEGQEHTHTHKVKTSTTLEVSKDRSRLLERHQTYILTLTLKSCRQKNSAYQRIKHLKHAKTVDTFSSIRQLSKLDLLGPRKDRLAKRRTETPSKRISRTRQRRRGRRLGGHNLISWRLHRRWEWCLWYIFLRHAENAAESTLKSPSHQCLRHKLQPPLNLPSHKSIYNGKSLNLWGLYKTVDHSIRDENLETSAWNCWTLVHGLLETFCVCLAQDFWITLCSFPPNLRKSRMAFMITSMKWKQLANNAMTRRNKQKRLSNWQPIQNIDSQSTQLDQSSQNRNLQVVTQTLQRIMQCGFLPIVASHPQLKRKRINLFECVKTCIQNLRENRSTSRILPFSLPFLLFPWCATVQEFLKPKKRPSEGFSDRHHAPATNNKRKQEKREKKSGKKNAKKKAFVLRVLAGYVALAREHGACLKNVKKAVS